MDDDASLKKTKSRPASLTMSSILLALLFLFAGGTKLAGWPTQLESFAHYGYPVWFMYVVGLIEVCAAILVAIPSMRFYGAILLFCDMAGAIFTHLKLGEPLMLPVPAVVLLLSSMLAWYTRPSNQAK